MADVAPARPSRGRWYILLIISVMYLITYLDRVNISTAAPLISKEFGFDKITMGYIFSAFVWAYALFQVPGGWLSDRFGARRVLGSVVAYWSIMTAVTLLIRNWRGRRLSGCYARDAAVVSAARARLRSRHHP
jgi:sugar phosphate permease